MSLYFALSSSMSGLRRNCQLTTPVSSCLKTQDKTSSMTVSLETHTHTHTSTSTKSKLVFVQNVAVCVSEEDSEEDEADIISREALKRQSQLIIDSKSKKKSWKKKKGKFWSSTTVSRLKENKCSDPKTDLRGKLAYCELKTKKLYGPSKVSLCYFNHLLFGLYKYYYVSSQSLKRFLYFR